MGLNVAHQAGIIHRDIKPENLFLTPVDEGTDLVKILDFGIAKLRLPDASAVTGSGVAMGTFFYMAPEQIRDAGKVDVRADVWALGVVLYELLSGQKPFDGADVAQVIYQIAFDEPAPITNFRSDVPPSLAAALAAALRKDPNQRFVSVLALADAIFPFTQRHSQRPPAWEPPNTNDAVARKVRSGTTSHAAVTTLSTPPTRADSVPTVRRRGPLLLASALLLTLVGIGSWLFIRGSHTSVSAAAPSNYATLAETSKSALLDSGISQARPNGSSQTGEAVAPLVPPEISTSSIPLKSEQNARSSNPSTSPNQQRVYQTNPRVLDPIGSQPVEHAPETASPPKRGPISIDTNSPY
jgi:serine/threonine-protein kinase